MAAREGTKAQVKCSGCKEDVKKKDRGVSCDLCESWYHAKCGDIPDDLYTVLTNFDGKKLGTGLHWYCPRCEGFAGKLLLEVREIKVKQGGMEKEVAGWRKEMEIFKNELQEIRGEFSEKQKTLAEAITGAAEKRVKDDKGAKFSVERDDRQWQVQMKEMLEREKRHSNLVIMGLEEDEDCAKEFQLVTDMIDKLMVEVSVKVEVVGRIGKKEGKMRPLRIKIEDIGHRRMILTRAKKLKGMKGMEKIYIVTDMTRMQQEEDKKLRDKIKSLREDGELHVKIINKEVVREIGGVKEVLFKV